MEMRKAKKAEAEGAEDQTYENVGRAWPVASLLRMRYRRARSEVSSYCRREADPPAWKAVRFKLELELAHGSACVQRAMQGA